MRIKKIKRALEPYKELVDIIEKAESICGFSILENSRTNDLIEARSVIYQVLNKEKRITTDSISKSLARLGFTRNRSSVTHSLLNFNAYYKSSEFTRELYADLTSIEQLDTVEDGETPKRDLSELELYLLTLPLSMHDKLLDVVKLKVGSFNWKTRDDVKSYEMEV